MATPKKKPTEKFVKDIRQNTRRIFTAEQKILIYSGDGQSSACMAAYLTVLGYDVKTLLYGGNQLFYSRMRLDPLLQDEAFKSEEIMNYPYVVGN